MQRLDPKNLKTNDLDPVLPKWFALYTKSRAEKKVYAEIVNLGIEAYLPLKKELKQWSDRKKWVEFPLFSSYVFVRVAAADYYRIPSQVNGFVAYLTIRGHRIAIRDSEIETIKLMMQCHAESVEILQADFKEGDRVLITEGVLQGQTGKLITLKGKSKVAIHLEDLQADILIEIPQNQIRKILPNT